LLEIGAGGLARDAALAIHAIAIILGAWGSLAVLFVPKFMIIWNYEEYQKRNHGGPLSKVSYFCLILTIIHPTISTAHAAFPSVVCHSVQSKHMNSDIYPNL
jgi:hypothetical protein